MTRRRQLAILGGLLLVLFAVWGRALWPSRPTPGDTQVQMPVQGVPSSGSSTAMPIPDRSAQREAQRQRAELLELGRDPFTSRSRLAQASGLHLSGILWDATQSIAIINGQMVSVGEEIDGYRIVEISQHHLSVTDGPQTFQLFTFPETAPRVLDTGDLRPKGIGK